MTGFYLLNMMATICAGLLVAYPVLVLCFSVFDGVKQCFHDLSARHAKRHYPSLYDAASSEQLD